MTDAARGTVPSRALVPATAMVVFAGPLPPPVHGLSRVNQTILDMVRREADVKVIDTSPRRANRGLAYVAVKASRVVRGLLAMPFAARSGARVFYGSVDGGIGAIYTAALVGTARLLGLDIYLHHHSWKYVAKKSRIMSIVTRAAGPDAVHLVLCAQMAVALAGQYSGVRRTRVLANSVEDPVRARAKNSRKYPSLTIGLLSNLSFEKGLADFVDILEVAISNNIDVRGILAGPALGSDAADYISRELEKLGDRLSWRGPVSGSAKSRFFDDIDLFVFPSKNDCLPLVLIESLVHGVPVLAPARGCIGALSELQAAEIIPLNADFKRRASDFIARLASNPAHLAELQESAFEEGSVLNNDNRADFEAFAQTLVRQAKGFN